MKLIAWLRSPFATLCVLALALMAQLPHAADVFRMIVGGDGLWPTVHSYSYALALELAVLVFVVQHRQWASYAFAAVSVMVNLAYYSLHGVNLLSVPGIAAWLVSIALPCAIALYSHSIADAEKLPNGAVGSAVADGAAVATAAAPVATAAAPVAHGAPVSIEPASVLSVDAAPVVTQRVNVTHIDLYDLNSGSDAAQAELRRQALLLRTEGLSNRRIAEQLGVAATTVGRWLREGAV